MALVVKDRVLETSNTNGTGTFTLAGAVNGFQAFSVIGIGNTTYYAITEETNNQWEVGLGTVGSGTLTRDTVLSSSNSGSKVDFADGLKQVFCDYPANKAVYLDASDNVSSLGTITSGVWNGSTIPVANGGTGVTTSSGANSVVLRDANVNINANAFNDGYTNTAASGTPIVLTVSSVRRFTITGSGGQTIKLPDATTLVNGEIFEFDNNQSSGAITVNNNSNTLVVSVPSGGLVRVNLLSNAIAAGSWDRHDYAPSNVSWSTNTLDYAGSITSATWNGNVVQVNRGGTGANTLTGYVKGSGTTALTASSTIPNTDISGLGTMSTQNASAVAITGGTIDNAVIGGTTPAAGTFTTITGQTEVLKGTGENLFSYSQDFTQSFWNKTNLTVVGNATTAPDSTTTAGSLTDNSTNSEHRVYSFSPTLLAGVNYTLSVYVKASTQNYIMLSMGDGNVSSRYICAVFNLSNATMSQSSSAGATLVSTSITSAGSGWYRIAISGNITTLSGLSQILIEFAPAATGNSIGGFGTISYAGTGTTLYAWGAQLEFGTSVNTYIPTTTTAIYGTPTLSFSGVAGLGLESNGSLYVSPAGTGALQAQATTSSTVGGNARGVNATDWQTSRSSAGQVASASQAVIGGGASNTASGAYSVVGGGNTNLNQGAGDFIGGGNGNATASNFASVVGGQGNSANGFYNVIGGGYTNSGTSSSTVTTQTSATTSGSTAVTLAASNASIKVGQMVRGTGIQDYSYVTAISGTSLTLSQNANSTQASTTLQFYTPHGIVVGGGNNQATGSYSFIGGGGDAGTAANRNVASGAWSFVGGGNKNTASGDGAFVGGGGINNAAGSAGNTASGESSVAVGGILHTASGKGSFIGSGYSNNANAQYSTIAGGVFGTARGISGNTVFPACVLPVAFAAGVSQAALLVIGKETTNATATALTCDGGAAGTTNQVILPNNSAYYFTGEVISGVTGGGNTKGWEIAGVIKRGANAGATTLVGSTVTSLYADAGAATWTIGLTADTTNGGLAVTFTGQASTTIRTVCQIRTTEMTY